MKKLIIILAVLALMPVAAAQAAPVYFMGTGYGQNVSTHLYNGSSWINRTGFVGQLELSWTNSTVNEFIGYCLTLNLTLLNPQDVTVRALSELPDPVGNPPYAVANAGDRIAWLLNNISVTSSLQGAALQVAIWEVLYDPFGSYNLSSVSPGNFWAEGAAATQAADYLRWMGSSMSEAIWLDSGYMSAQRGQDYGVSSVPEPGSMLMLGTGLIGLGMVVRRKARK